MLEPSKPFPLPEGHYFGVRSVSALSHERGPGLLDIRGALGFVGAGLFDSSVEDAVKAWQAENGLSQTGIVNEVDWVAMFQPAL